MTDPRNDDRGRIDLAGLFKKFFDVQSGRLTFHRQVGGKNNLLYSGHTFDNVMQK